ncbi:BCCT family transporter [Bacteroides sp.]|uniref:BCCT family transporter n=1 Tax=Bacteroides sp. TaxID=29523 RepID=UPI0026131D28|nr:BCCT family transporter [Bacteroides sp.]MDD3039150.1 BCCT family transporter [Bacteroides sp.]
MIKLKLHEKFELKSTFVKSVAIPSLMFIVGISLFCGLFPVKAQIVLSIIKEQIFANLSWFYVISVTVFVIFLISLALSKHGKTKLGSDDQKPEYSFFSWVAMLFAAGMGIGLMYFGVAEPISHYANPASETLSLAERAKEAQLYTFFHWGLHAWAIYAVVGLSLAYFTYRYKLPLSLRSVFYPMLKDKIHGRLGNIIDVFALCSTFFGLATTLGFGVVQLNAGLANMGIMPQNSFPHQAMIVVVIMLISIISSITGLGKGVKLLSQINISTAVILMLFILFAGPTVYLLGTFSEGIGNYFSNFISLTFNTYSYEPGRQGWFSGWTILYWAWWISWSPYVGLFIAKISKGRTIREFIFAVILIPSLFNFLWMTIFGNTAIWMEQHQSEGALSSLVSQPEILLFSFLKQLPLETITTTFTLFIICIFFITSADSGIYVMNNIATKNAKTSPKWQNIFWGVLLAGLSLSLLSLGGLDSLQTMTLVAALPFAVLMLMFCYNLLKALNIDARYHSTKFSHSTSYWSGRLWKERLERILTYSKKRDVKKFIETTVVPAFKDLIAELKANGIEAKMTDIIPSKTGIELEIVHNSLMNFKYGVKAQPKTISDYLINEENAPEIGDEKVYIPVTYFNDGRKGYDIQYFTKEEVISDILKQYERFLSIISDCSNELYTLSND